MKIVALYSYKGGSGRTVATANVAKALVEMGEKVLVIDMDAESAGLSYVFDKKPDARKVATQDILADTYFDEHGKGKKGGLRMKYLMPESFMENWGSWHYEVEPNLWFIPARYSALEPMSSENADVLFIFLERLHKRLEESKIGAPTFVLLDSPSGLQDWARKLFGESILVVFFRWSKQFTYGTIRFLNEELTYDTAKAIPKAVILVPSAVPEIGDGEEGLIPKMEEYRDAIDRNIDSIKVRFRKRRKQLLQISVLGDGIPECATLKWDEKVLIGKSDQNKSEEKAAKAFWRLAAELRNIRTGDAL
jgi:MinD-like ATPase involved in chromosome partitioning or flagellar assembly